MGLLSVLKGAASKIGKVLGFAEKVVQEVSPFIPPDSFVGKAVAAIVKAESVAQELVAVGSTVSGQGKLAIADAFAQDALHIAELVAGRTIGDQEKYNRGVASVIAGRKQVVAGIADILDSLHNEPAFTSPAVTE